MHPVVGGRREHAVQPTEPADVLGVDPELVQQHEQPGAQVLVDRQAQQRHRQEEGRAHHRVEALLAQRGREVEMLALVMHGMRGPEQRALVTDAMQPVVAEVVDHDRDGPSPRARPGRGRQQRQVRQRPGVQAALEQRGHRCHRQAQHALAEAADRIGQPVVVAASEPAPQPFKRDAEPEQREGDEKNAVHGGRWRQSVTGAVTEAVTASGDEGQ